MNKWQTLFALPIIASVFSVCATATNAYTKKLTVATYLEFCEQIKDQKEDGHPLGGGIGFCYGYFVAAVQNYIGKNSVVEFKDDYLIHRECVLENFELNTAIEEFVGYQRRSDSVLGLNLDMSFVEVFLTLRYPCNFKTRAIDLPLNPKR